MSRKSSVKNGGAAAHYKYSSLQCQNSVSGCSVRCLHYKSIIVNKYTWACTQLFKVVFYLFFMRSRARKNDFPVRVNYTISNNYCAKSEKQSSGNIFPNNINDHKPPTGQLQQSQFKQILNIDPFFCCIALFMIIEWCKGKQQGKHLKNRLMDKSRLQFCESLYCYSFEGNETF
jgi:hypothetical protein